MTPLPSLHNRLLAVAPANPLLGSKSLAYAYDGLHRRVLRAIREWTGSAWQHIDTTGFLYDDWNVAEEYRLSDVSTLNLRWAPTRGTDLSPQENALPRYS